MTQDLYQVYHFPSSKIDPHEMLNFILRLQTRFPDCSRGIMQKGWRSPIGQWMRGIDLCPGLSQIQDHLHVVFPPMPDWDFFTWFEITEQGGTMTRHSHFEHQWVARYAIEGAGPITIELGNKLEVAEIKPGQILITPGIAKDSIPAGAQGRRISAVINANMVWRPT